MFQFVNSIHRGESIRHGEKALESSTRPPKHSIPNQTRGIAAATALHNFILMDGLEPDNYTEWEEGHFSACEKLMPAITKVTPNSFAITPSASTNEAMIPSGQASHKLKRPLFSVSCSM